MVTYDQAHYRLRAAVGRAAERPCAEGCGRAAQDWAYDHADPAELTGCTKRGRRVAFSLDPAHYRPLCRSCHARADKTPRSYLPAPAAPPPPAVVAQVPPPLYPARALVDLRKPLLWTGLRKRCSACGMTKDRGAFSPQRDRGPGAVTAHCRPCAARRFAERYAADPARRAQVNARRGTRIRGPGYSAKLYAKHRARAVAIYGGACVWCGSTERLEFDHVGSDGSEHRKSEPTNAMLRRISRAGVQLTDVELQLLCVPCHRGPGWKSRRASGTPALVSIGA